ncbi:MAG: hypothetical protein K5868_06080 [Lachnospiraceae bacterium]|nr:hypothetical protein [Lachnospiraceae bacterium]
MRLDGKKLKLISLLYMYIPIALFLFGYTKWYFALPTMLILTWAFICFAKDDSGYIKSSVLQDKEYDPDEFMTKDYISDSVVIHPAVLAIACLTIIFICIIIGIGGAFPQAGDWEKHNAVLRDLIRSPWPVYYDRYDKSMLTYYLGQYLVPAVIGKLFYSFDVGNIVMAVWCVLGLILAYLMLIRLTEADSVWKQILGVYMMLFFCGALCLVQLVLKLIYAERMYSVGSYHWVLVDGIMLQYRSNLVMLRWVIPQVIVPWLATMMLIEKIKKVEYYVLILLPSLLFGSFSFAALAAVAIITVLIQLLKHDITITKVLALTNILPGISLGSILFFYFLGNIQVDKPISSAFRLEIYDATHIWVYVVFCVFMFGIYSACVWPENKNNPVYYANLAVLLVLPWFRMGLCNDVVMSGSIPSLFILMIMVFALLIKDDNSTSLGIRKGIALTILVLGMIYPICEISDNIKYNSQGTDIASGYPTMKWFTKRGDPNTSEDLMYNYYTYDMDGKIFYEYIARTKL